MSKHLRLKRRWRRRSRGNPAELAPRGSVGTRAAMAAGCHLRLGLTWSRPRHDVVARRPFPCIGLGMKASIHTARLRDRPEIRRGIEIVIGWSPIRILWAARRLGRRSGR